MLNGAAPVFDLEGGLLLAVVRAIWVAALLSAFGASVFRAAVAPRAVRMMPAGADCVTVPLDRLTRRSLWAGLAAGLTWFVVQSQALAGAAGLQQIASALPKVLLHTAFGHLLAWQLAATLLAAGLTSPNNPRSRGWTLAAVTVAVVLQAGHGHAASMYAGFSWLLLAGVVHLVAAGAWLGGLLPLLLVVQHAPAKAAATAARRFSPLGKLCVAGIAGSAAFQGWVMVGSIPAVVGTGYGWMIMVKLVLLAVLLGFAAANRYRFAPALVQPALVQPALVQNAGAARVLVRSLTLQTAAGMAVIVAAAVLSGLAPSMHVQPVWPFTETVSLAAIQEDAGFLREVIVAALALAAAVALLVLAAVIRRPRWVPAGAVIAAAMLAWIAIPHFDLLFIEAYPTSYAKSPTGFAAAAIVQGAALYPAHCAACHGAGGHGDGPAAAGLADPPADLTADHLWMHSDGELIWWLSHGIAGPDGALVMPGFAGTLSEDERWALIDAIHALNAGDTLSTTGAWSPPLHAPAFAATCNGRTINLAGLRGQIVRLVIGPGAPSPATPGVTTIRAAGDGAGCVTADASVPAAYAMVSGIPLQQLAGSEFLIDGEGWLRAVQRPGSATSWNDPATLASQVQAITAHPVQGANPAAMHMQM